MKHIKFKNNDWIKYKLIFTVCLTFILSFFLINRFSRLISEAIINTADALIKRENALMFKKAFGNKKNLDIDVYNLLTVQKNSNNEIVAIDFNVADCEKIMIAIVDDMNYGTNMISTDGYILYIPLGYVTNSPLLLNLGPKIPLKISTTDVAMGSVSTNVKEFGINNALIEVYVNIEIETNALLPLKSGTTKEKYSILIASKIINGKVPNFYGKYSQESSTIDIPIT